MSLAHQKHKKREKNRRKGTKLCGKDEENGQKAGKKLPKAWGERKTKKRR